VGDEENGELMKRAADALVMIYQHEGVAERCKPIPIYEIYIFIYI